MSTRGRKFGMGDWAGKHLGNYHLLHVLGEGGFAEVYLGEHMHLGTQAAIKVLSTKLQREEVERFRQEARTIAGLRHPSIVRVLDFGVAGSVPYLVMDYATGGTLRQRYPGGTRLEPAALLPYVRQVASALQYTHERTLIHRDVKPENMLIGEQGEILLSDFGIALVAQSSRYQGTQEVAGTVAYMAPEQVQGKPQRASDQYALGVVVYEWLEGERPFHGSFTEIAAQQVVTPPPLLRAKLPDLSLAVEQVVLRALEKDPQARFASVQAFATALEQACQMQGVFFAPTQRGSDPAPVVFPGVDVPPVSPLPSTMVAPPASSVIGQAPVVFPLPARPPLPAPQMPSGPAAGTSRRTVLIAGGAMVGLAVVGGGFWLASTQGGTGRSPTSPSTPPPTLPYTYLYSGHSAKVFALAWSPDSTRIASGSFDRTVQVWDAARGGHVFLYRGYAAAVYALAWSPDGTRIASGGEANTVQVWDAPDGNHVFTYDGHSQVVNALAWSPDGTSIASASLDKTVQVWQAP
jgi:serine/threonine protein kinase